MAKRAGRTRLEVDERRAQLLALGIRFFSTKAYDEVSIEALAQAAGISKGLLYHYFPTKRDYYAAALQQVAEDLLERTRQPPEIPPLEKLDRGLDAYLDYVQQRAPAYVALMRGGIGSDPEIARIVEGIRSRFLERIVEGMGTEPPPLLRVALRGWIGFVEAASLDAIERGDLGRPELRSLLTGVLALTVPLALGGPQADPSGFA